MVNYKKVLVLGLAFLIRLIATAQTKGAEVSSGNEGLMRSEGKIYVVLAVVVTILAGLLLYIMRLDRKITKLEKGENF